MKFVLQIIGTLLILGGMIFLVTIVTSITDSSHNISVKQRNSTAFSPIFILIVGLLLMFLIWIPRNPKRN
jgi:predicted histidine transporter YuiF (NhaC family)